MAQRPLGVISLVVEDVGGLAGFTGTSAGLRRPQCQPGEIRLAQVPGPDGITVGLVEEPGISGCAGGCGAGGPVGGPRPGLMRG